MPSVLAQTARFRWGQTSAIRKLDGAPFGLLTAMYSFGVCNSSGSSMEWADFWGSRTLQVSSKQIVKRADPVRLMGKVETAWMDGLWMGNLFPYAPPEGSSGFEKAETTDSGGGGGGGCVRAAWPSEVTGGEGVKEREGGKGGEEE